MYRSVSGLELIVYPGVPIVAFTGNVDRLGLRLVSRACFTFLYKLPPLAGGWLTIFFPSASQR
jgi:hypothetical protein